MFVVVGRRSRSRNTLEYKTTCGRDDDRYSCLKNNESRYNVVFLRDEIKRKPIEPTSLTQTEGEYEIRTHTRRKFTWRNDAIK